MDKNLLFKFNGFVEGRSLMSEDHKIEIQYVCNDNTSFDNAWKI